MTVKRLQETCASFYVKSCTDLRGIQLRSTRYKKNLRKKAHVRRASFLSKSTCRSFSYTSFSSVYQRNKLEEMRRQTSYRLTPLLLAITAADILSSSSSIQPSRAYTDNNNHMYVLTLFFISVTINHMNSCYAAPM